MMKPGYQSAHPQRGAIDPESASNPEATMAELAHQAHDLETRIQHLKAGIHNLGQLEQAQTHPAPPEDRAIAQAELAQLQKAVDDFEVALASRVLGWQLFQEPFWQAVRYGGLGLVLGWLLHWLLQRG